MDTTHTAPTAAAKTQVREESYVTAGGKTIRVRFTISNAEWEKALQHLASQANGRGGKSSAFQGAIVAEVIESL